MLHFVGVLSKKPNINKHYYQKRYFNIVKNRQSAINNLSYPNKVKEKGTLLSLLIDIANKNKVFQKYRQMSFMKNKKSTLTNKLLLTLQLSRVLMLS